MSPIVELAREGDRVTGAIVEREGQRLRIKTRRGVVLACGGFPANEALRRRLYRTSVTGNPTSPYRRPETRVTVCG